MVFSSVLKYLAVLSLAILLFCIPSFSTAETIIIESPGSVEPDSIFMNPNGSGGSNDLVVEELRTQTLINRGDITPTPNPTLAPKMKAVSIEDLAAEVSAEALANGCTLSFTDLDNHWGKNYVHILECLNIVSGRAEQLFAPEETITRQEIAKISVLIGGHEINPNEAAPFADIVSNDWSSPYIAAGIRSGAITGDHLGNFNGGDNATRAESITMLVRSMGVEIPEYSMYHFNDIPTYAWHADIIEYAYRNGLIQGYVNDDGEFIFCPNKAITRAEYAKMAVAALEILRHKNNYQYPTEELDGDFSVENKDVGIPEQNIPRYFK